MEANSNILTKIEKTEQAVPSFLQAQQENETSLKVEYKPPYDPGKKYW